MSVLSSILEQIKDLLEGSTGINRTISVNKFEHLSDTDDFLPNRSTTEPRPFIIIPLDLMAQVDEPSDVAGNYCYFSSSVDVQIFYADEPHDRLSLFIQMVDDSLDISKCLMYPLNWSQVDNWVSTIIELETEPISSEDDESIEMWSLTINLFIEHREEL